LWPKHVLVDNPLKIDDKLAKSITASVVKKLLGL
jgi:hypothetical protein